jgi:uncharacterized protein
MGIMDKLFGKSDAPEAAGDIDQLLQVDGDAVNPPADFYVKKVELRNDGDADMVIKELSERNIVIVNVLPLSKQPNRLKTIVGKFKSYVTKVNGDIAVLGQEMVLLTPAKVKIVKNKPKTKE